MTILSGQRLISKTLQNQNYNFHVNTLDLLVSSRVYVDLSNVTYKSISYSLQYYFQVSTFNSPVGKCWTCGTGRAAAAAKLHSLSAPCSPDHIIPFSVEIGHWKQTENITAAFKMRRGQCLCTASPLKTRVCHRSMAACG